MSLFTKKDLGLLLPDDTPGDPISLRHTETKEKIQIFQPLIPKRDISKKVYRYRAGKIPDFIQNKNEIEGFIGNDTFIEKNRNRTLKLSKKIILSKDKKEINHIEIKDKAILKKHNNVIDKRNDIESSSSSNSSSSDESSEDEDEIDNRRERMRKKILLQQQQEEIEKKEILKNEKNKNMIENQNNKETNNINIEKSVIESSDTSETDSSSSSSSDDDSSDDSIDNKNSLQRRHNISFKPIFIPKDKRETIKKKEEEEKMQELLELQKLKKKEIKKLGTKEMVKKELEKEKEEQLNANKCNYYGSENMPDDTDGLNPEEEYHDWEIREMKRIKRDHDQQEEYDREKRETLRRRNMTEKERRKEDERLGKLKPKEKKQWKFLQKYYHKGAFYMDEKSIRDIQNDVRKRDASDATLEDKFNKELLPKVMQVKNFGKAGRTKYTHLLDQDTSVKDSLWHKNDRIRTKYQSKMAGIKNIDSIDSKKRKKE